MRSTLLLLFIISILTSTAYATIKEANAVSDTAHTTIITMNGIGDIKVGMKINDLSRLLNKPVMLKNLLGDQLDRDTINVDYKEVAMQVVIGRMYLDNDKTENVVWEVKSSSPQVKTRSGINIGDDKLKIITTYDGYMIYIIPEYENNYTTKSKNKSTVWLHDESGKVIVFYLFDNKVTAITVTYDESC